MHWPGGESEADMAVTSREGMAWHGGTRHNVATQGAETGVCAPAFVILDSIPCAVKLPDTRQKRNALKTRCHLSRGRYLRVRIPLV